MTDTLSNPSLEQPNHPAAGQVMKTMVETLVVGGELNPVTNEGLRYGALLAAEAFSHNPGLGAVVLGGATALVEGAGALAAADLLTRPTTTTALKWLNTAIKKFGGDSLSTEPSALEKIGRDYSIATTIGTPALMSVKQRRNPDRSKEEARRSGLMTVAWMTGYFAVEGAAISEGYGHTKGIIAGSAIAVGIATMPMWVKRIVRHYRHNDEGLPLEQAIGEVSGMVAGGTPTEGQIDDMAGKYEGFRNDQDEAVKVGLYGEDLKEAFKNPSATLLEYTGRNGEKSYMPLLVPAKELVWYNMDLLKSTYGYGKEFYYYAHPPIPEDEKSREAVRANLQAVLDRGDIIFTDEYIGQPGSILHDLSDRPDGRYALENLGGGDLERNGQVFVAPVNFGEATEIKEAPPLIDVYREAVASGELTEDLQNGVALTDVIEGDDAERIWEFYKAPFEKLSKDHPMYAGYEKEVLMGILGDPTVEKIVNRVDGEITTLCFFVQDFDNCPWFNRQYYEEQYPEYYNTKNILIFPGIVTDENKRNLNFAAQTIGLATKLYAKRGSNMLITFECTEISAGYIPNVVNYAINHSGAGHMDPIDGPISTTVYRAIKRA